MHLHNIRQPLLCLADWTAKLHLRPVVHNPIEAVFRQDVPAPQNDRFVTRVTDFLRNGAHKQRVILIIWIFICKLQLVFPASWLFLRHKRPKDVLSFESSPQADVKWIEIIDTVMVVEEHKELLSYGHFILIELFELLIVSIEFGSRIEKQQVSHNLLNLLDLCGYKFGHMAFAITNCFIYLSFFD